MKVQFDIDYQKFPIFDSSEKAGQDNGSIKFAGLCDQLDDYSSFMSVLQDPETRGEILSEEGVTEEMTFKAALCLILDSTMEELDEKVEAILIEKVNEAAQAIYAKMEQESQQVNSDPFAQLLAKTGSM